MQGFSPNYLGPRAGAPGAGLGGGWRGESFYVATPESRVGGRWGIFPFSSGVPGLQPRRLQFPFCTPTSVPASSFYKSGMRLYESEINFYKSEIRFLKVTFAFSKTFQFYKNEIRF
jgi:hypothetical protein